MEKKNRGMVLITLTVLLLFVMLPLAFAETTFDPKLVEAAKKEGKVSLYNSGSREAGDTLLKAFKEKFGISGEQYRATSNKILTKVMEEIKANNIYCDVVTTGSPNVLQLQLKGLLQITRRLRKPTTM